MLRTWNKEPFFPTTLCMVRGSTFAVATSLWVSWTYLSECGQLFFKVLLSKEVEQYFQCGDREHLFGVLWCLDQLLLMPQFCFVHFLDIFLFLFLRFLH